MLQGLELQCSVGDNKQSEKSRPTKNQLEQLFHLQFLKVILDLTKLELFWEVDNVIVFKTSQLNFIKLSAFQKIEFVLKKMI